MRKVTAEGAAVREARIVAFNLPAIIGLSTSGSFEYMLEALEGQAPADVNNVMSGVIGAASRDRSLARVFSTYTASNPMVFLDIDRGKGQALGLNMSDVFTALEAALGGIYVNMLGRTWQVNVQGEAANRDDIPTSGRSTCATIATRAASSPIVRDEPHDALAVGGGETLAGFGKARRQPVDPELAVRVQHHLDDGRIVEPSHDRRSEGRTQHSGAARDDLSLEGINRHAHPA